MAVTQQPPAPGMFAPLRHQAFRWLALGRFTNFVGNAVAPIALAFAVLDLTGSLVDLGLVVAARSVANVALMLYGGVLADRLPRAVVLQGSALAAGVTQAFVAVSVLAGFATVPLLVVLAVVNGAAAAPALPAAAALTPQTVPADELQPANALVRMSVNVALVGGAAFGGVLVGWVGPGWGIALDALTFLVAAACFARVRVPPLARTGGPSTPLADLRAGWYEFRSRTWVWTVVLQFMVVNAVIMGAISVIGPKIADDTFGRQLWGLVLAAETAGLVLGGLLVLRLRRRLSFRLALGLIAVEAVPLIVLAEAPRVLLLIPAMLLSGMALEQFSIVWDVALQQQIPPDKLARVYSYDALGSFVAIPVGQVVAGPLAVAYGERTTLLWAAALLVAATVGALCSPGLRDLARPLATGVDPPPAPAPTDRA